MEKILNKNKNNTLNFSKLFEKNSRFVNFKKTFKQPIRDYAKELNALISQKIFELKNKNYYKNTQDNLTNIKVLFGSMISKYV